MNASSQWAFTILEDPSDQVIMLILKDVNSRDVLLLVFLTSDVKNKLGFKI